MSLEHIFGYTPGTDLVAEKVIIKFLVRSLQKPHIWKEQNTNPFFVMNTRTRLITSALPDFRETWQEYVNPCAGESFRIEIFHFFSVKESLFSKKLIFR